MAECDRVSRFFGTVPVLRQINFQLGPGELAALFGGNGAGKTTLLTLLAGGLKPTQGQVRVGGAIAGSAPARRQTGLLGHASMLQPALTVAENLRFYARLHDAPEQRAQEVLELLEAKRLAERRVGELSQGMRQTAALARCLLHRPRLLLLDEPFASLDVAAVAHMRRRFADLRASGLTLIVTSHAEELVRDLATVEWQLEEGRLARRDGGAHV